MNRTFRTGAGALCLALSVTACTGDGGEGGSAPATGLPSDVPNASGGIDTVTWNLPFGEPGSLDPVYAYDQSASSVTSNMCESLLTFNEEGKLAPNLASEFAQPDASTLVLTIRRGVTFWDGRALTAEDVAFNLQRNVDGQVGSFWSAPWFTNVKSVEVTGADEVTVKLIEPDAVFAEMLATNAGQISEKKVVERLGDQYGTSSGGLMCTGPFQFSSWKPGESLTITKNPNYWDPENSARAEEVVFRFVTDPATLTSALESGEIDGSNYVPVSSVSALRSTDAGTLYAGESLQMDFMVFSSKPGPINDPAIRTAISMALDRKAIAESIYKSAARPAWTTAGPKGLSGFDSYGEGLVGSTLDLDGAKKLVQDSSVDTGATITLAVPSEAPATVQLATYVQGALAQVGLKVEVRKLPYSEFGSSVFGGFDAAKAYHAYIIPGYLDIPDPLESFIITALPGASVNISGTEDPEMTAAINEARKVTDPEARKPIVGDLLKLAAVNNTFLVLSAPDLLTFMSAGITGAPIDMFSILSTPWAAGLGAAEAA